MEILLKLKSWQMFLLIIAPMILPSIVGTTPSLALFFVTWFFWMSVLLGWIYSVGKKANSLVPDGLQKSTTKLKVALSIPIVYSVLFSILVVQNVSISPWIVPIHLLSMVCIFYAMLFSAKQLVVSIKQEKVGFFEYCGPFFLFWFSPIGVWFLQPKINRLIEEQA
ncbi:hypothetical protein [Vibrio sp. VPAP30]|uniref:hypothetical protein n=1 Tax=Vibrio sp. VPAP30 TaxID=1647102 RepID=UPI0006599D29|nr:hypothetical protein [Vibrio sp. VPAP30]KLN66875.1 hypothetical protein ZX61_01910 [Vibrio sp. VPAP30]